MAEPEKTNIVDAMLDLKKADPFEPFRVVMISGDKYLIESGETLVELRSEFFYASPRTKKFVLLRKAEIVAVEGDEEKPRRRPRRRVS
jgi:hypothetical protein